MIIRFSQKNYILLAQTAYKKFPFYILMDLEMSEDSIIWKRKFF